MAKKRKTETHEVEEFTSEEKRFYLPGVAVTRPCPQCGAMCTWSGENGSYLSYPTFNALHFSEELHFVHEAINDDGTYDEHEFTVRARLGLVLEVER